MFYAVDFLVNGVHVSVFPSDNKEVGNFVPFPLERNYFKQLITIFSLYYVHRYIRRYIHIGRFIENTIRDRGL